MRLTDKQRDAITEAEKKVVEVLDSSFPPSGWAGLKSGVSPASTFSYGVWKLPNYQRLRLAECVLQRPLTFSKNVI